MSKKNKQDETNAAANLFEDGSNSAGGDAKNFEKELARLEEIVDKMENGGLGLEWFER